MPLTKTQSEVTAMMLDMAADEFSNHGSNDFELDNTPENLEFVRGMIAASDYPDDTPSISRDGKKIYTMDWKIMQYCKHLVLNSTGYPVNL